MFHWKTQTKTHSWKKIYFLHLFLIKVTHSYWILNFLLTFEQMLLKLISVSSFHIWHIEMSLPETIHLCLSLFCKTSWYISPFWENIFLIVNFYKNVATLMFYWFLWFNRNYWPFYKLSNNLIYATGMTLHSSGNSSSQVLLKENGRFTKCFPSFPSYFSLVPYEIVLDIILKSLQFHLKNFRSYSVVKGELGFSAPWWCDGTCDVD